MQQKVLNVLGRLSKIWLEIDNSTQCKTDRVEIGLNLKNLLSNLLRCLGKCLIA